MYYMNEQMFHKLDIYIYTCICIPTLICNLSSTRACPIQDKLKSGNHKS